MNKKEIEERHEKIVELRKQGLIYEEIAKEVNISNGRVSQILKEKGIEIRIKSKEAETLEERNKKIIKLRQEGYSQKELSEKFDIAQSTISVILKKYNMPKRVIRKKREKSSFEEIDKKIIGLREQGLTIKQIAEQIGYSATTVIKVLQENNIEKPIQKNIVKRNKKIKKLREQGLSYKQIAEQVEHSVALVSKVLEEEQTEAVDKEEQFEEVKQKEEQAEEVNKIDEIVALRKDGLTQKQISEQLRCSIATVSKVLREKGMSKRENGYELHREAIKNIIQEKYNKKEKADLQYLERILSENYNLVEVKDIQLVLKIYVRQGQIRKAIALINSLKNLDNELNIKNGKEVHILEKEYDKMIKVLEEYQIKSQVKGLLKEEKSTNEISKIINVPETIIIKIKRELEQKAKEKSIKDNETAR